jgi:hypothetical protein
MDAFPALKEVTTLDTVKAGMRLTFVWLGSKDSNIGLHFDPADGYLAQLWGRKAFYLFPYGDSASLYPLALDATRSHVDLRTFELNRFPRLEQVAPYAGELEPGDLLFVPKYCWHYFWASTDSVSASVFEPTISAQHASPASSKCTVHATASASPGRRSGMACSAGRTGCRRMAGRRLASCSGSFSP